jgi:Orsellinic acid/F9775 biosynthesis cluster protein D
VNQDLGYTVSGIAYIVEIEVDQFQFQHRMQQLFELTELELKHLAIKTLISYPCFINHIFIGRFSKCLLNFSSGNCAVGKLLAVVVPSSITVESVEENGRYRLLKHTMPASAAHGRQNTHALPHELFHYLTAHEVLICTACHYAVQPNAVVRHLKDIHHLSSEERRPFAAYTNSFKLRNPEEVEPPCAEDFPVACLPVEKGWKCKSPGCYYLCVSIKRMQNHWPAQHGCRGDSGRDWRPAPLQTFFRGNMTKYFTKESRPREERENSLPRISYNEDTSFKTHMRKTQERYKLDTTDSSILEYYFHSAYKMFTSNAQTEQIWLDVVPGLVYGNEFLLHGILACTAQYMIYMNLTESQKLNLRACTHWDCALPVFREAIDNPTEENCDAIMAFSYLLVVYTLATDGDNSKDSLLLVGNDTDSQGNFVIPFWLHFLREGCSMLCDIWDRIEKGPVGALAATWEAEVYAGTDLPYWDYFQSLIHEDLQWSGSEALIYSDAALSLSQSFATMKHEPHLSTWEILALWPLRVDFEFETILYRRHPGALILLAYYCIILKQMDGYWYFERSAARLIAAILNVLDAKWHRFIQEPINRVVTET